MPRLLMVLLLSMFFVAGQLQAQDQELSRLIKQLDAEDFAEREAATKAIVALGEKAVPHLKDLLVATTAPERRLRAEQALKEIDRAILLRSAVKLSDLVTEAQNAGRGKLDAERLQALLDRLATVLEKETGTAVTLPVLLKDTTPAVPGERMVFERSTLHTFKYGSVAHLRNSIVLASVIAEVSHADNCIIIAGTAAQVSHSHRCIIIAGERISVAHDRGSSVMLSGGELDLSFSNATILGAAGALKVSHHSGTILLNRDAPPGRALPMGVELPPEVLERMKPPRAVKTDLVSLPIPPQENPLAELLSVTALVEKKMVVYRRKKDAGEYVARINQSLEIPGEAFPELKGWKVTYVGSGYAVFENDDQHVAVRKDDPVE